VLRRFRHGSPIGRGAQLELAYCCAAQASGALRRTRFPLPAALSRPSDRGFNPNRRVPAIAVTMSDIRCSMVNLDPDSASPASDVLKAVVRANQNNAGIYGAVTRIGRLAVGQTILLHTAGRTISERPH